jgi:chemotaxis protein MotB
MANKMKKEEGKSAGGESGTGRWMLTYLDMVTLLFGVFVIMYAMSNVNREKAEKMTESIRSGFHGGFSIFYGPAKGGQTIINNLQPAGSPKETLYDAVSVATRNEIDKNFVTITETNRGVRISFTGDLYFESGSARLTDEMTSVLSKIIPILKDANHPLVIAGFTDDVQVHSYAEKQREFSNNWQLAALRAINVLRYCEDKGIAPSKMSIQSFGKYQPLDMSINYPKKGRPEFRSINRRVDIFIETGKRINQRSEPEERWK